MNKVISGHALRDRLLRRLGDEGPPPQDAWVQALATPGNRDLLGLIARRRPQSISELSEFAGRAQPNVSRSLTALIRAGLVKVKSEGRASVPTVTSLGRDKAKELGLLEQAPTESIAAPPGPSDAEDSPFLSVTFAEDTPKDDDAIVGTLAATLNPRGYDEPVIAKMIGDLNATVLRFLDDWWRMLYRRDAPYRIGDFDCASGGTERRISLAIKSTGSHIERIVRPLGGGPLFSLEQTARVVSLKATERNLIDGVVRPVVAHMCSRRRYDRPIQSKLARLEDSLTHTQELVFARTMGALGGSPYDLSDEWAAKVRNLIEMIPDEEARLDFASAVLTDEVDAAESWTSSEISKQRERNAMARLRALSDALQPVLATQDTRPWQRGTAMARTLRSHLKIGADVATPNMAGFAAMFGADAFQTSPSAPGSLRAFQSQLGDVPTIVVEEEGPTNTKFILARAIGDFLVFRNRTSCVANLYTDRQAVGRAFAAEFIAPAEGVVRMIEDDDESVDRVARHYGAPEVVIHHQYENNYRRFLEA